MNYDLNVEQKLLKKSAHDFLTKECSSEYVREMALDERGFSSKLWKKMADLGWLGLLIPEKYGGVEMSFLDMAVLLFEMGYVCLPGPFFSSSVTGVLTLLNCGSEEQKQSILPLVADGKAILTLALSEPSGSLTSRGITATGTPAGDHYILSGTKLFVPDANVADLILCAVRTGDYKMEDTDGISLFIIEGRPQGLTIERLHTMAGDKQCEVTFENVKIPRENLLGELNRGWSCLKKVIQEAAVGKAAEMSGGAQKVLEMVVEHAKTRVQFDKPIGSFQAIQHHCADILTYLETSTFIAYESAWRMSEGLPYKKNASMSKAWVSEAYRKLVSLGHQVMGGTGFMEETDLQLYFKHAKTTELAYGDASYHRELVAQQLYQNQY